MVVLFRRLISACRPFIKTIAQSRGGFTGIFFKMPPVSKTEGLNEVVKRYIDENKVMIFSKSWCPFCTKVGFVIN